MSLPLLATVQDLADWIGEDNLDGDPRATAVLRRASALVRSEAGMEWADGPGMEWAGGAPEDVQGVVVAAAARVWTNPNAAIQRSAGSFSERLSERAADGLYLTDEERRILSRYSPSRFGVGTIRTYREDGYGGGAVWVPTAPSPSGQGFPFGEG